MTSGMPNDTSITAINHGAPSFPWIRSSNSAPTIAPGIVPITRAHAIRSSGVVICRAAIERNQARRYRATSCRK